MSVEGVPVQAARGLLAAARAQPRQQRVHHHRHWPCRCLHLHRWWIGTACFHSAQPACADLCCAQASAAQAGVAVAVRPAGLPQTQAPGYCC